MMKGDNSESEYGPMRCQCELDELGKVIECEPCENYHRTYGRNTEWKELLLKDKRALVIQDYMKGMARAELAVKYKVDPHVIIDFLKHNKIVRKGNVRPHYKSRLELVRAEMVQDFQQGMSFRAMGVKYKTTRAWVRLFLQNRGFKRE